MSVPITLRLGRASLMAFVLSFAILIMGPFSNNKKNQVSGFLALPQQAVLSKGISTSTFPKTRPNCRRPHRHRHRRPFQYCYHPLNVLLSNNIFFLERVDPEQARTTFFFFFFAGSGAFGIGAKQIPAIYKELSQLRSLDSTPTEGGETFSSPLAIFFYPTPLSKADVARVIENVPTPQQISSQGISKAYMAVKMGYVERGDYIKAMSGGTTASATTNTRKKKTYNPLAIYAVFDALSGGKGTFVSPQDMETKLAVWRSNSKNNNYDDGRTTSFSLLSSSSSSSSSKKRFFNEEAFAKDLQAATTAKLSSYLGFVFLLLLVVDLIVEEAINGFFL